MADITVPAAPASDPPLMEEHLEAIARAQGALRAWRVAACDHEFENHISELQVSARAIAELLCEAPNPGPDADDCGLGLVFGKCLVHTAEQALWATCSGEAVDRLDAKSMREIATLALQHLDAYVEALESAAPALEVGHV